MTTSSAALLTFVIVGGGPTGVEMAGAIAEVARQTLARDFRRIDPRTAAHRVDRSRTARCCRRSPGGIRAYATRTLPRWASR